MRKSINRLVSKKESEDLYRTLYILCQSKLEKSLADEGYALSEETLKDAAEMYAEELVDVVSISITNLIADDMVRLKDILETINTK